jgi:tetratricopeptide (TPR) repeat protein
LGKFTEAAKDLERALQLDPNSLTAQRELSRAYFALGKTNEALRVVTRALGQPSEGPDRASLLINRAEILKARKEHQKALDDTIRAIREHPSNVEWYLIRSQLQDRLNLPKERIKGLEEGMKETGSGVLETEWIDALIDDGQHARALEKIEGELQSARLRSSWLIRRARVSLAIGKSLEAKSDLETAVEELNRRINATAADPALLADRALARDLLGKKEEARKDYEQARDKGLTDEWVRERIRALQEPQASEKE